MEWAHFSLAVVLLLGCPWPCLQGPGNKHEDPLGPTLPQSGMWTTLPQETQGVLPASLASLAEVTFKMLCCLLRCPRVCYGWEEVGARLVSNILSTC